MWMSTYVAGACLALGALLLAAAALKLRSIQRFEVALVGLVPSAVWRRRVLTSRTLAWSIVAIEGALGLGLVLAPTAALAAVSTAAATLFLAFLAASIRAVRVRRPCGCHGHQRPADWTTATRALLLAIAALALCALVLAGHRGAAADRYGVGAVLVAIALLGLSLTPEALRRLGDQRRARFAVAAAAQNIHGTGDQDQVGDGVSRRSLIRRGLAAAGAAAAVVYLGRARPALAGGGRFNCAQAFDDCYTCCGGVFFLLCTDCCGECYSTCLQVPPGCAPGTCFGCWP